MTAAVVELIRARLETTLQPTHLDIRDDSHLHVGHAGAREGGHYHVTIAAEAFRSIAPLARHRQVYAALDELLAGSIHALSIDAQLPENRAP
jgi:BolA family transcriptional regulator, general stress-responsive regulator